jgi:THO complex subunit 1
MLPLQPFLDLLLSSLPPLPISKAQYDSLVKKTLDDSSGKSSPDNRKNQWEYLLKNEVFKLAVRCSLVIANLWSDIFQDD